MEGGVDAKTLVDSINTQSAGLAACVPLIRETDKVVGSLNVQVTIKADGAMSAELQSPVNPKAEKCLLDGMRGWKAAGTKAGRAMVLLTIEP
jgi:hypothetical protein